MPATVFAGLENERLMFAGALGLLFEQVDLLLVPVMARATVPAIQICSLAADEDSLAEFLRFTAPFDFSGSPTITMPCGFTHAGLPIGFQLVAPHLAEDRRVAAGRAFQQASDWHRQRPTL